LIGAVKPTRAIILSLLRPLLAKPHLASLTYTLYSFSIKYYFCIRSLAGVDILYWRKTA